MNNVRPFRIFCSAVLVAACITTAARAQGKLEIIGGDIHDWGTVAPGKLTAVVEVKNIGAGELNITDVHPSCSCTASPIDKKVLGPGEIGKISIPVDAANKRGLVEKTITIASSDPTAAVKVLRLRATIKQSIMFTPSQYFTLIDGKVGVEMPATTVRITNSGDSAFTVFPPELAKGNVRVRFDMTGKKELKVGEELELKAYITPLDKESISGTVKLKTTDPEYPTVDLTISGTLAPVAPPAPTAIAPMKAPIHSQK
ncbi:MAG: DUF1573 domain-containing protein [Bacteroidota bacterium]